MSAVHADPIEAETPFARARAHAAKVEGILTSDEMIRKSHSELEAMLAGQGQEWARLLLEENLRLRAQLERRTAVVGAEGVARKSARDSERHLETLLGRVPVPRLSYQAPGATDLHPMDAALNLPREMFSHGIRRMVAKEAAKSSFDEVVETVRDFTGASIAKRQVEELAIRAAQDFDAFYEERAAARDPSDDLLVISTDGKGIVMRHEDLREGTRRAAKKSARKLETRLTPGEKSNRKRMAQVATVYSIAPFPRGPADILHSLRDPDEVDAKRPRPTDKRVWASVEKPARMVIRDAFAEALRRDPEKTRRWVVLVDGEPKQLRAVKTEARRAGVKVTILADIVHVIEYIWGAARALFGESNTKAEKWVEHRLHALLAGRSGGEVAKTIRWWEARDDELDAAAHAAIDKTCRYLADRTRTRLLHYQQALRDGLPIATGVIEGACRYVVKDRMDRTGARWSLTGAEAVLRLRAIRASKDFDAYWAFHLERERERNHASRYEDGKIPDPLPAPKPRLKRVK
ncbi:MAG: ISKra4 family transposase [Labilithrix sp.]|nr:ISKra4 family transposase [Labilithrix sp.]MBX3218197.1 ISKra4 family transposase [Labilithrix sp.]